MRVLKVIGVVLFLWLLLNIDRDLLLAQLRSIQLSWFIGSFLVLLLSYVLKVIRWHLLIGMAGARKSFRYAWETYNVGTFLGMITPGKVGEFGRVGYLRAHGIGTATAITLVILDRVFDAIVIAALGLVAVGILFGTQWAIIGFLCALVVSSSILWFWQRMRRYFMSGTLFSQPLLLLGLLALTLVSWIVYCAWPLMLAESIGLRVPFLPFFAAIIVTGIIALFPIAPSGLGTRDAALIWLLQPFGIAAPQALALSFLMFISIVASSLIGAWYWIKGVSGHSA